jgi:hypothetical protein
MGILCYGQYTRLFPPSGESDGDASSEISGHDEEMPNFTGSADKAQWEVKQRNEKLRKQNRSRPALLVLTWLLLFLALLLLGISLLSQLYAVALAFPPIGELFLP